MNARLPARQLALTARACVCSNTSSMPLRPIPSDRRTKWSWTNINPFSRRGDASDNGSKTGHEFDKLDMRKALAQSMQGRIQDSIFDSASKDFKAKKKKKTQQPQEPGTGLSTISPETEVGEAEEGADGAGTPYDPEQSLPATITELATDPHPRARVRLQRKLVAQMVRRGTRPATREERIARSERVMTFRSPWMATSVKKLGMLARQISGKTVEDALVQMKFSKKKHAREVAYRLREARDLANVKHGMGLGMAKNETATTATATATATTITKATAAPEKRFIQTKSGKWIKVADPTRIYIDEVWVNRGPFRPKSYDMKGRGRFGVIRPPSTSISFRLKEDKTRVRIYDEKKAKERKAAPWVHLPDRPIHGQRPYYSW